MPVECDFFMNTECLVENQLDKNLIVQRRIYDIVKNVGDIENIKIDKNLLYSMHNAHYKKFLAKQLEAKKQLNMEILRKCKALLEIETNKIKYLIEIKDKR